MNNATSFFGHGDRFGGWDPWNPWLNGRMEDPLGIMQQKVVTAADADDADLMEYLKYIEIYPASTYVCYFWLVCPKVVGEIGDSDRGNV